MQADLSLRLEHMSDGTFSQVAATIFKHLYIFGDYWNKYGSRKSIDWCIKKILGYYLLFVSSGVFHFISHKEIWVTLAYQGIEN